MRNIIVFVLIFVAFIIIPSVLSQTPPYLTQQQNINFDLNKAVSDFVNSIVLPPPPAFQQLFISLGFPEEVAGSWLTIIFYGAAPVLIFGWILGNLIGETLGEFSNSMKDRPWVHFAIGILTMISLMVLGIVGPFILWLYLNASAMALYMVVFIFIAKMISKFTGLSTKYLGKKRENWLQSIIILLIFGATYLFGWAFSIYGWILSLGTYFITMFFIGYIMKHTKGSTKSTAKRIVKQVKVIRKFIISPANFNAS